VNRSSQTPSQPGPGAARAVAVGAAASVLAAREAAGAELDALLEKIPPKHADEAVAICRQLAAGGPDTVEKLVKAVGNEFGSQEGVKAKYALHALVVWSARPGADEHRKMVASALAGQLAADHSSELKAFIVRHLQWCGRAEDVPALAGLLGDDRLCEPATQALLALGGKAATDALRGALPKARGKRRATILKALGRQRDPASVAAARREVGVKDGDLRLVAYYALGNIGKADGIGAALEAAGMEAPFERSQAVDAALLLGRRLAEGGQADEAMAVFRKLLAAADGPEKAHERSAALHEMALAGGTKAVGDVLAAMGSGELRISAAAARTAVKLAALLAKDKPKQARQLLLKVRTSTREQAVIQRADSLLGELG